MARSFNLTATAFVVIFLFSVFSGHAQMTPKPGFTFWAGGDPQAPIPFSYGRDVAISGNYAFLVTGGEVVIIDISTPQEPVTVSHIMNGQDGASLADANSIFLADGYAYVTSTTANSLEIIDISDPLTPTHVAAILDGAGGAALSEPGKVRVVGNYAYVAAEGALEILDITTKTAPVHKGKVTLNGGFIPSTALVVAGNYAYVGTHDAVHIVNISDPAVPVLVSSLVNGDLSGAVKISRPLGMELRGNYLFVTAYDHNSLEIFDVSDPASPTPAARLAHGTNQLEQSILNPSALAISGDYAYIPNANLRILEIANISDPLHPEHQTKLLGLNSGDAGLEGINAIAISGNYAYTAFGGGMEVLYLFTPSPPKTQPQSATTSTSFNANWSFVNNALGYFIDVSADNFATFLPDLQNKYQLANFEEITGLTASTTYQYRVRAVNINGTSGNSHVVTATTTTIPPSPVVSAVSSDSFTISWDPVDGATAYTWAVALDEEFTQGTHAVGQTTGTTATATQMQDATTYWFGIAAVNAGGNSVIAKLEFTTTPVKPFIVEPDVDFITQNSFKLEYVSSPGAGTFFLDVSTEPTFATFVSGYENIEVFASIKTVTGLLPNTTYYTRMRAANIAGPSANSLVVAFLTLPASPVVSAATSIAQGSFIANWTEVPNIEKYYIDVATDVAFGQLLGTNNNRVVIAPASSVSVSGLTAGTTYYYRLRCSNDTGTSPSSGTITAVTLPVVPTTTVAQSIDVTSFDASWAESTGATTYFIDVATDAGFANILDDYNNVETGDVQTFQVSGLSPGTSYYYRLRASNPGGTTLSSSGRLVVTAVAVPEVSSSNIAANSYTISWDAIAGATGYKYDLATDNAFALPVAAYFNKTTTDASIPFTGLLASTTYYARVYAKNSAGVYSAASTALLTLTLPNAPTIAAPVANLITSSSFRVSWTGPGASSYFVDVATDVAFISLVTGYDNLEVTGSTLLEVDAGILPHTTYYVRVRSANAAGPSLNSATEDFTSRTEVPVASISTITASSFTLSWSDVGATAYRYDLATDVAFAIPVTAHFNQTTAGTSADIDGLLAATTYYARVYSTNSAGLQTAASTTTSALTVPAPPTLALETVSLTSFKISWTASGATTYNVDVATDEDFVNMVSGYEDIQVSGAKLLEVTSGLLPGTNYYVRVRSSNATGPSLNSSTLQILTLSAALTATAATSSTQGGFQANWTTVPGADKYFIDVSADEDFDVLLTNYNNRPVLAPNVSLAVSGLATGTVYYYRVRSSNSAGTSPNSNVITTATLPEEPSGLDLGIITQTTFDVDWHASSGATEYFIDVSTDNSFATFLAGYENKSVGNTTTATVTGLTTNSAYYIRVRAANLGGSTASATLVNPVLTAPAAPVATAATNVEQTTLTANWNAVSGVTDYRIDVSASDTFTPLVVNNVLVSGSTSFGVSALTGGTIYYYRVRAVNATAASTNSNVINQLMKPATPTTTAANPITQTTFRANWNAVPSATEYFVDVKDVDGNVLVDYTNTSAGTNTFLNVTIGIEAGTNYSYVVRAKNDPGLTPDSSPQTVLTVPPTPVALAAGNVVRTGFNANWETSKGATEYFITVTNSLGVALLGYEGLSINPKAGQIQSAAIQVNGDTEGDTFHYKVTAKNGGGSTDGSNEVTVNTPAVTFPSILLPTGGKTENYRIISIPDGTTPSTSLPDGSFGTSWRIMHYNSELKANEDVPLREMKAGRGYWVNSNLENAPEITLKGQTLPTTKTLTLLPGWNQIGDPFNFDISWSDVLAKNTANASIDDVGDLYTYNVPLADGGYHINDGLLGYGGGFVFNQSDPKVTITLTIPADVVRFTGRKGARNAINNRDIAQDEWFIPLTVESGGRRNELGGFGMHPNARPGIDKYDAVALPRLAHLPDLSSNHPEFFQPRFMKDVVPTSDLQTWKFDINTPEQSSDARLTWDNTGWGDAVLYLIDDAAGAVINMNEVNEYAFSSHKTKSVTFAFGKHGNVAPEITAFGQPFPNPSADRVTFPFVARQGETVNIHVMDLTGRSVGSMKVDNAMAGYQEAIWDSKETGGLPPGVYLYQFTTSAGVRRAGRIVLK